jgi:hypothetical protein
METVRKTLLQVAKTLGEAHAPVDQHAEMCRMLTVALLGALQKGVLVEYEVCATLDAAISAVMLKHRTDSTLQQHSCTALATLAKHPAWRRVDSSAAAKAVVAALSAHKRDAAAQLAGCIAFDSMSAGNPVFRDVAGACGAVEAVVGALIAHPGDAHLQRTAAVVTHRMTCQNASNKAKAAAAGAVGALLSAMHTHAADAEVQHAGCEALANMTVNAEAIRRAAFEVGAAQAVVTAMRSQPRDGQVQQSGCRALRSMLDFMQCTDASGSEAVTADAIAAIIAAIRSPAADFQVRHNGCYALRHILLESGIIDEESSCLIARDRDMIGRIARLQTIAASNGGGAAVLGAARAHAENAMLQEHACFALSFICKRATVQQARTGAARCVQLAAAALKTHTADVEVTRSACALLQCISQYDIECQLAAGAAIPAVLKMMRNVASADAQASGCFTMFRMTFMNETNADIAGAAAIDAALAAMRAHTSVAALQRTGCSALGGMVRTERARLHAHAAGAGAAMLAAMRAHPAQLALQSHACMAFGNMLLLVAGRDMKLARKAINAVLAAMRGHPEEADLLCNGCFALGCIARSCREAQAATVAAGGLDAALAVLRAVPSDDGSVQASCCAIAGMCRLTMDCPSPEAQAKAAAAGCIEAVIGAMQRHAANVGVQEHASAALAALVARDARNQVRAGVAGAPGALVAALHLAHASTGAEAWRAQHEACSAARLLACNNEFAHKKLIEAGVLEALAATLATPFRGDKGRLQVLDSCCYALKTLLPGHEARAVCAGVADALSMHVTPTAGPTVQPVAVATLQLLQAAVDAHDGSTAACAHDGCVRCANLRASGAMCAQPGCGARVRADDSGKKRLRCGGCRAAVYCGAAHQSEDWTRHRRECRALREKLAHLGAAASDESGAD